MKGQRFNWKPLGAHTVVPSAATMKMHSEQYDLAAIQFNLKHSNKSCIPARLPFFQSTRDEFSRNHRFMQSLSWKFQSLRYSKLDGPVGQKYLELPLAKVWLRDL